MSLPSLFRYVDDFFGAERPACAKHALSCIERVVKLMLGSDAVAADKCEWGTTLTILGVDVAPQHDGFVCAPDPCHPSAVGYSATSLSWTQ